MTKSLLTLESYLEILYKIVSYTSLGEYKRVRWNILYHCVEGMNQSQWYEIQSPGETQWDNHNGDIRFFSRGSRACRHFSACCVNQHLVVQRLRGVARTSCTQLDTARTYPQVRYLNDMSHLLELAFDSSSRKVQAPSKSLGDGHDQLPTRVNPPPLLQAI